MEDIEPDFSYLNLLFTLSIQISLTVPIYHLVNVNMCRYSNWLNTAKQHATDSPPPGLEPELQAIAYKLSISPLLHNGVVVQPLIQHVFFSCLQPGGSFEKKRQQKCFRENYKKFQKFLKSIYTKEHAFNRFFIQYNKKITCWNGRKQSFKSDDEVLNLLL